MIDVRSAFLAATVFGAVIACAPSGDGGASAVPQSALDAITADDIMRDMQVLSSDAYAGRAPGTRGEDSTVAYLTAQFQAMGLAPGNPDGSYVQNVAMVGITSTPAVTIRRGGTRRTLRNLTEVVANSRHERARVDVTGSELVFVGYGVSAPEYGWDDYKDVDVRGKTILMLVNDPPVTRSDDSTTLDDGMFRGKAMTYYGRWTYKYEIASAKGAAAALIVHETGPAGYPWEVVVGSWGRENVDVVAPDGNAGRVQAEGWITTDVARELLAAAGADFDSLKHAARTKDFRPVSLGASADIRIGNRIRRLQSRNVVARLPGSDPAQADEHVIYTAHWDHLGVDATLGADSIFNGAVDNASGTAALLALARGFASLPEAPRRSVMFAAVTAEESGLLGARYLAGNPLVPLTRTVANINLDGLNVWGRTSDITVIGLGNSTLDDDLTALAAARGRSVVGDPETEKGYFYRSDHFEFAKQGIPALYIGSGTEYIGKPAGYGMQVRAAYDEHDYHKPSDEIKPDWDLAGGVDDTRLLFEVGYRLLQGNQWPQWKPGTEFKARRDSMMAGR